MRKHCPLAFNTDDIYCSKEECQWWDVLNQCCVVCSFAKSMWHLETVLASIHDELKELRKINQVQSTNLME